MSDWEAREHNGRARLWFVTARPQSGILEVLKERTAVEVFSPVPIRLRKPKRRVPGKRARLEEEVWGLVRLLTKPSLYRRDAVIASNYAHFACLLFARLFLRNGEGRRLYLFFFQLRDLAPNPLMQRLLRILLTDRVGLMVQSPGEYRYFHGLAPQLALRASPFCQAAVTDFDDELLGDGDYVFSGGFVNRDYELLLNCSRQLPETEFVIACSSRNDLGPDIPPNVRVLRDIPSRQFNNLLAGSRLLILPLRSNTGSSGQTVALTAMQMGKAIAVPDFDYISQYVEDGRSGMVYQADDAQSMVTAVKWALANPEALRAMGSSARERWLRHFTLASWHRAVSDHAFETLDIVA